MQRDYNPKKARDRCRKCFEPVRTGVDPLAKVNQKLGFSQVWIKFNLDGSRHNCAAGGKATPSTVQPVSKSVATGKPKAACGCPVLDSGRTAHRFACKVEPRHPG